MLCHRRFGDDIHLPGSCRLRTAFDGRYASLAITARSGYWPRAASWHLTRPLLAPKAVAVRTAMIAPRSVSTPDAQRSCWPPSAMVTGESNSPALAGLCLPEMGMRLPQDVVCEDPQRAAVACVPAFSYAFQPIVDVVAREVYSYEALIRGRANEPAFRVLPPASD